MSYLIDTHAIIWFLNGDDDLSDKAKKRRLKTMLLSISSVIQVCGK